MLTNLWKKKYEDLAKELQNFYIDNINKEKSVGQLFYDLCTNDKNESKFHSLFGWTKNITQKSIDPLHIFSSFNNSGTTMENKQRRFWFYYNILTNKSSFLSVSSEKRLIIPLLEKNTNDKTTSILLI